MAPTSTGRTSASGWVPAVLDVTARRPRSCPTTRTCSPTDARRPARRRARAWEAVRVGAARARPDARPPAADDVELAAAVHRRRLRRLLRLRAPRHQRRQDLPPRRRPLTPNWKHLPIGYHGRAGTVVVSGTRDRATVGPARARRRRRSPFGPSTKLDIEAELGFVVGAAPRSARRCRSPGSRDHVFGVCLVNDWSARDIQAWEYVPLGPFLGKSFATSISPWIIPLPRSKDARVAPPAPAPDPLAYLETRRAMGPRPRARGRASTARWSRGRRSRPCTGRRRRCSPT